MKNYRVETDTMGEVQVPSDALYGAQTQRAIDNFGYQFRPLPQAFIRALVKIKSAAATANANLGCITQDTAQLITNACSQILAGEMHNQRFEQVFPVSVFQTGSGTSTNMNVNEVIAQLVKRDSGAELGVNDQINYGQSSNDVIPSAIQVAAVSEIVSALMPALTTVCDTILKLSQKHRDVLKTGRTHLMDAMPMTLGDELLTWHHQFDEAQQRISQSLPRLQQLPLGGTAIGTGINRHRDYPDKVCQALSDLTSHSFSASSNQASRMSSQDPSLEMHGQLKVLATVMIKIANDIRWMNSGPISGLAEIQLKALQPGSSIMPAKVNPVMAESIIMQATEVIANDTKLTLANQSGNHQLNTMLPLIADTLLGSIELLTHALQSMSEKLLDGFTVNQQRMMHQVEHNPILVTALNTHVGYQMAAKIAKQAIAEQRSIKAVALELTNLSEEQLEDILDPEKLARPFDH